MRPRSLGVLRRERLSGLLNFYMREAAERTSATCRHTTGVFGVARPGSSDVAGVAWYPKGEMTEWRDRVTTSPEVCHGAACVRGTRIPVSVVLDNLADGLSAEEILASYPSLTGEDVRAAVAYGAELARERVLDFPRHAAG
jgi:uncharacterized protein (DUF433 family)